MVDVWSSHFYLRLTDEGHALLQGYVGPVVSDTREVIQEAESARQTRLRLQAKKRWQMLSTFCCVAIEANIVNFKMC